MSLLDRFQRIGITSGMSLEVRRSIILCNSLSLLVASMPILFTVLVMITRGSATITPPVIIQPLVILTPVIFNAIGFTTVSRVLLSSVTPGIILIYSIYNKSNGLDLETSSYVGFRITMVATSILPVLLFTLRERGLMFLSYLLSAFFILGFDPLHAFFGVSYTDAGLTDSSYSFTNARALIAMLIIGSCALILKNLFEKSEKKNIRLIEELGERNEEIKSQFEEISASHDSIKKQKEIIEKQYSEIINRESVLLESQRKLDEANSLIRAQQELLKKENKELEQQLIEKNVILEKSNKDLIQLNADLHQFTYMASHNLRGPIASLLGLLNIIQTKSLDSTSEELYQKARISVQKLESVVDDLGRIVLMDNNLLQLKEKIYWIDLINKVLKQYQKEIREFNIKIDVNVDEAPYIITLQTILFSIVNNLINNAIKFRSPERQLTIQLNTRFQDNKVILEVEDNGLGMDLPQIGDRVFMMYRRFHDHVEGKGLGLFFIKEETEILGGHISVNSELNRYTKFTLEFPVLSGYDEQVLFESGYGAITFNAFTNSIRVNHLRPFNSQEYQELYTKGLDYFKKYNVINAVGDMRQSNPPDEKDQQWLLEQIVATAAKTGLRHVAIITNSQNIPPDMSSYLASIEAYLNKHNIKLNYFTDPDHTKAWLEDCNRIYNGDLINQSKDKKI